MSINLMLNDTVLINECLTLEEELQENQKVVEWKGKKIEFPFEQKQKIVFLKKCSQIVLQEDFSNILCGNHKATLTGRVHRDKMYQDRGRITTQGDISAEVSSSMEW